MLTKMEEMLRTEDRATFWIDVRPNQEGDSAFHRLTGVPTPAYIFAPDPAPAQTAQTRVITPGNSLVH
jgi:hypothetical protein